MNIAVLASTNGSNLPSFFSHAKSLAIPCVLITNKPNCKAIEKAIAAGVEHIYVDPTGKTREAFDAEVLKILQQKNIEHVFCIGYMRIISSVLINAFPSALYNIHPSLLPSFGGGMDADVHAQVLQKGCRISGATLHLISEAVDEGPILLQKSCPVMENDTSETLKQRVQAIEQQMLWEQLVFLKTGRRVKEHDTHIPVVHIVLERNNEIFMIRRHNTGYADGQYSLPAGHVEKNESFIEAAIREAKEEVGVEIQAEDCRVVHLMHRKNDNPYTPPRIVVFVQPTQWQGEPYNAEPEKCSDAKWCHKNALPQNTVYTVRYALENMEQNSFYSQMDF